MYSALRDLRPLKPLLSVVYCDTGVEIPVMRDHVRRTLRLLRKEAQEDGLNIRIKIAQPTLSDRYFVKVIGRGYPPPTNKFRWCTDRLRILPIQNFLKATGSSDATVVIGTRLGESVSRDRILANHRMTSGGFFFKQAGLPHTRLFAPIVDFELTEVWRVLQQIKSPVSVDGPRILSLYKDAGAECPVVRDEHGPPCGSGRFGCWTCTVVRKDKAITHMVSHGHDELAPLLEFRNWLAVMRDDPVNRCRQRRNGVKGLGPLTLDARREVLSKLKRTQAESGLSLISDREIRAIKSLWFTDRKSAHYHE